MGEKLDRRLWYHVGGYNKFQAQSVREFPPPLVSGSGAAVGEGLAAEEGRYTYQAGSCGLTRLAPPPSHLPPSSWINPAVHWRGRTTEEVRGRLDDKRPSQCVSMSLHGKMRLSVRATVGRFVVALLVLVTCSSPARGSAAIRVAVRNLGDALRSNVLDSVNYSEPEVDLTYLSTTTFNARGMGTLYNVTNVFLDLIVNEQAYPAVWHELYLTKRYDICPSWVLRELYFTKRYDICPSWVLRELYFTKSVLSYNRFIPFVNGLRPPMRPVLCLLQLL
uniref:Uncharacterized protein n=1 Tax=Timema bartmani TaxID=61472 RepID=A0A7R9I698_9NEOP|nr:unnamed protein product [Timema bartmani]